MDATPILTPDFVIRRVLKVLSEVRREFSLDPLEELQELSILAGKHACRMAAIDIPFGHDDINDRQSAFPLALAYSENIALTPACADPGAETIMNWMGVSTTCSRLLSQFTHTGVVVAESQDGSWYVTQIYPALIHNCEFTPKDTIVAFRFQRSLRHVMICSKYLMSISSEGTS
jgi:hypothetical protein